MNRGKQTQSERVSYVGILNSEITKSTFLQQNKKKKEENGIIFCAC